MLGDTRPFRAPDRLPGSQTVDPRKDKDSRGVSPPAGGAEGPSHPKPSVRGEGAARGDKELGFYAYTLRDVMSRNVVTVRPDASLEAAAGLMSRNGVSGLPVVDPRGNLTGVISQKDVIRVLHEKAELSLPGGVFDLILQVHEARRADLPARCREVLETTRVEDVMSREPISIGSDATMEDGIRTLMGTGINRLPVLHNRKLVGIVTRHDLLAGLAGPLP